MLFHPDIVLPPEICLDDGTGKQKSKDHPDPEQVKEQRYVKPIHLLSPYYFL
jgi:hypothetical protein